ncbi:MAG TPA: VWA domain-containing protein [Ktedonobacterales bacterium]|nr:VWA domain-containing protein [Ktedonobacterales bacterium]
MLQVRPERRIIPHEASQRHVDLLVRAEDAPADKRPERPPLTLALVLDRSGSMSGDKIATAKRAASAVLQRLDERDTIAVVVFDDHIDTIQPPTRVTDAVKAHVSRELERIGARGTTALHEGWLTGCNAIAGDERTEPERGIARCFLLTDGLANMGLTDPEQIASQAGGIREKAGIGTSTFGIGADYAEELLGPMAEAGGGRFHHLRSPEEISTTFVNELGELLATAAANVELDLEVEPRVDVEFISTYRSRHSVEQPTRWTITLGDLMSGEERHTIVRLGFAETWRREEQASRARVRWTAEGAERSTDWQEFRFAYASDAECEAEPQDADVMRWAGQHQADRAQREALRLSKRGNLAGAGAALVSAYRAISAYSGDDAVLVEELAEIEDLKQQIASAPLPSMTSKERYMMRQAKTRGQRDLRTPNPGDANKPDS